MWLVRGYIKYKANGLKMSDSLRSVVVQYRESNDVVLQFFNERCERAEGEKIKAKDLYQAFKVWAKSNGEFVLSARKFNAEMDRHSDLYERRNVLHGFPFYWGIKLRSII